MNPHRQTKQPQSREEPEPGLPVSPSWPHLGRLYSHKSQSVRPANKQPAIRLARHGDCGCLAPGLKPE
ncbi:MAG TPA: hypothetical protein VF099_11990, partial [Ktedonobacterales bacterium]